jgi:hypothetical protein
MESIMTDITNFNLTAVTTENFFNENETGVLDTINQNGTGVYKLSQNRNTGQFIDAIKVDSIEDENASVNELGRIVISQGDLDFVYVSFVV